MNKEEDVKIRVILSEKLWPALLILGILFSISLAVGLTMILVVLAAYFDPVQEYVDNPLSDPDLLPFILTMIFSVFIALATLISLVVLLKVGTTNNYVLPLIPIRKKDFIVCGDGIYAKGMAGRLEKYILYPWASLSLYWVDERKSVIGLKTRKRLLKLKAVRGFDELKSTILAYVPAGQQAIGKKPAGFRWGVFIIIVCILVGIGIGATNLYESLSDGRVGDGKCDICGDKFWVSGYGFYEDGELLHEYCQLHASAYSIMHPEAVIQTIINEGWSSEIGPLLLFDLLVWCGLLWRAVVISRSPWQRARTLKQ